MYRSYSVTVAVTHLKSGFPSRTSCNGPGNGDFNDYAVNNTNQKSMNAKSKLGNYKDTAQVIWGLARYALDKS